MLMNFSNIFESNETGLLGLPHTYLHHSSIGIGYIFLKTNRDDTEINAIEKIVFSKYLSHEFFQRLCS